MSTSEHRKSASSFFGAWLAPTVPYHEGLCALVADENSHAMTIRTSHVCREPAKGIVSFRLSHTGQCLRVCVIDGGHGNSELVTSAQTPVSIVSNASLVVLWGPPAQRGIV